MKNAPFEPCDGLLFRGTLDSAIEGGQIVTEQRSASKIDFEVLRRAEEQRDLDAMLDL